MSAVSEHPQQRLLRRGAVTLGGTFISAGERACALNQKQVTVSVRRPARMRADIAHLTIVAFLFPIW